VECVCRLNQDAEDWKFLSYRLEKSTQHSTPQQWYSVVQPHKQTRLGRCLLHAHTVLNFLSFARFATSYSRPPKTSSLSPLPVTLLSLLFNTNHNHSSSSLFYVRNPRRLSLHPHYHLLESDLCFHLHQFYSCFFSF